MKLSELRDSKNALITKYVYRGDRKRAWKQLANGTRSYFYYAGDKLIASSNGAESSSLVLWGADGIVGSRTVNSTSGVMAKFYNLYDTQGNLAQSIDASNGAVVSQSATSAWGEPIRDSAGNASGGGYGAKFGYVRDGESGFYLCTLRYYDPSAGRWITRDPIGYAGGSNLYGYALNDSVNRVDPSGLARVEIHYREVDGFDVKVDGKKLYVYHAYIQVWETGGKTSYIVRAGPSNRGTSTWGYLDAVVMQWGDRRNPERGGKQASHVCVVANDQTKPASFYLDKMRAYATRVNSFNVNYFPTGPNSNSFVSNLLEVTGLLPGARSRATPSVPGWGTLIIDPITKQLITPTIFGHEGPSI